MAIKRENWLLWESLPHMTHMDVGNAVNTGAIICPCAPRHKAMAQASFSTVSRSHLLHGQKKRPLFSKGGV